MSNPIPLNSDYMKDYDYLIVGAGISGAMFAYKASKEGKKCLVLEKNNYIGGFCYSENIEGIEVHKFGAHIFRTNRRDAWQFVNSVMPFIPFVNSPIARFGDEIYNLPFNMNTFHQLFGVITPQQAEEALIQDRVKYEHPVNLEQHILSLAGRKIYEKLVKGYTEKQWGKPCDQLPISIMQRIPLRMTYNNNYYNETYQGIPEEGYTAFIEKLLEDSNVLLGVDYFTEREKFNSKAQKIVFTGRLDEYFDYCFGQLEYRSVIFQHKEMPIPNFQGNAVVNYTEKQIPYTRTIEHKHFTGIHTPNTIVSYEYPIASSDDHQGLPSYPINDSKNQSLANKYKMLTSKLTDVIFVGRLAEYKYYAMNDIVEKFI